MKISRLFPARFLFLTALVAILFIGAVGLWIIHGIPDTGLESNRTGRGILGEGPAPFWPLDEGIKANMRRALAIKAERLSEENRSKTLSSSLGTISGPIMMQSPPGIALPKSDITLADLVNESFETGAKLGYWVARSGGNKADIEFIIDRFKARDSKALYQWGKEHDAK